jgi:sugar phosphate permease
MQGMLTKKHRLFPFCEALSDIGSPTLPYIGLLLPQQIGFPPTWSFDLISTVDAHLFWLPGVATHGQRTAGADQLHCPVFALGLVADAFGWRWAFYMVGIPGLIAAYLAWRISEPERGVFDREIDAISKTSDSGRNKVETAHSGIGKGFWITAKKILQVPTYLAVVGGLVFSFFTIGGTSFWLPTYLVNTFSLTVGQAGIITGAVLVGSGLVGTVVGGWLADYVQLRRPDGRLLVSALGFLIGALWF